MRTEKQRIVKQVLHTSFFPGSRISHLQRGRTSLFENHLTGFNVGSGGAPCSSASLVGLENSPFFSNVLTVKHRDTHELTCLVLLCPVGSKALDFSAIFCKNGKKRGKMAEKRQSKYLGKESYEAISSSF